MVQFDMQARTFKNVSAPCFNATSGISRGAMHYVPSFGPEGILLVMGGQHGGNCSTAPFCLIGSTLCLFSTLRSKHGIIKLPLEVRRA